MPLNSSPRPAVPPAAAVLLLTLLLGIQPVTTDLYLPALPTLASELGASMSATQLTLSALILSFGLCQLVAGPLADRFGRRPVLQVGLLVYTLASVWAALSPSIDALVAARVLQGTGMAAVVTCGRAIVRDLYAPAEGAKVMSRALGGLGVIAMLSPLLGGVLVQWVNWHAALAVLAVFGVGSLAFVSRHYGETAPRLNPAATQLAPMLANWRAVAQHRTFQAWALLLVCTYSGLFVILAASSFAYIQVLGLTRVGYGLVMAANSLAYIGGTFLCRRLMLRFGVRGAVKRGALLSLAGGLGMLGVALAGTTHWWALLLPQMVFAVGHGVHQPCGQSGAVGPFPDKAGAAASLSGFGMMVGAFVAGWVLGRTLGGTLLPMTLGVAGCACALSLVAWTLVQRHGDAPQPA
jgi:DHA1 family bicyclomycin/chloramphenicol resistance-like MFS transporter